MMRNCLLIYDMKHYTGRSWYLYFDIDVQVLYLTLLCNRLHNGSRFHHLLHFLFYCFLLTKSLLRVAEGGDEGGETKER